jgi:predicted acylesterase/phospholipase RssA
MMDLILSSGFLAFARHIGVLDAISENGVPIDGLCGTSSGALVGALWVSGMHPDEIARLLSAQRPVSILSFNMCFWRGLFRLDKMMRLLETVLPSTFEELDRPFGVGLCDSQGRAVIQNSGPLVPAVAASCAMPYVFAPVRIGDELYCDGGAVDRIHAVGWRAIRQQAPAIVHIVDRSHGSAREEGVKGCRIVRTPRSGAHFFSLKDFEGQRAESHAAGLIQLK